MKKFLIVLLCIILTVWLIFLACFVMNELNRGQMEEYIAGFEPVEYESRLVHNKASKKNKPNRQNYAKQNYKKFFHLVPQKIRFLFYYIKKQI